jgi:acyl-CoA thioester hydrolase
MIHGDRSSYTTDTCNDLSRLKDYATAVIRFMPVLSLQIEYKRPAKFDDRVTTRVSLQEIPSAHMELRYEIRSRKELLATAASRHAFTSTKGNAIRPPKQLMAALRKHWLV